MWKSNFWCRHRLARLFSTQATSAALCDACARQRDACSEHPDDAVCQALHSALAPAAVLADARGRALVWDACRVLHAAVYLPERTAPRCSVEVRCAVLSRADVLRHRDALVATIKGAM